VRFEHGVENDLELGDYSFTAVLKFLRCPLVWPRRSVIAQARYRRSNFVRSNSLF
jgi:hypothetical protein